jgi:hypothetical protein
MEIIQQMAQEFIKKIIELKMEDGISDFMDQALSLSKEFVLEMTKTKITQMDDYLVAKPGYRKSWEVVKKDQERSLETVCGLLQYNRRYYKNKKTGRRAHLIDKIIGVDKYERVDAGLSAKICTLATEHSYSKSSEIACEGALTRQTVMRKLRQVKEEELNPERVRDEVKIIHIQADEDHVAMQNGKRDSIVKLIAIHEPIERRGKRGYLPKRFCMTSYQESTEDFWIRVAKEIDKRYGTRKDLQVYIHGDGASWIKTGLEWINNSIFVLDKYHLNKYIRTVTSSNNEYFRIIKGYLHDGDHKNLKYFVETLVDQETCKIEQAEVFMRYVRTNKDGISVMYNDRESAGGSCAEGLVSHMLSSRLSSRPMGWLDEGLGSVSRLRIYVKNEGKIKASNLRKIKREKEIGIKGSHVNMIMKKSYDFAPMPTDVFKISKRSCAEYRLFDAIKNANAI